MTKNLAAVAVPVLILFGIAVLAQAAQPPELAIQGRILDAETQEPVAGSVTVFMNHDGGLVTDTTTTDDKGTFVLTVPTKPYSMLVWAERYAPKQIPEPSMELSVGLDSLRNLPGQVLDAKGDPVEGALVHVRYGEGGDTYLPNWIADSLTEQRPITGADGRFMVHDVIPGLPVVMQAEHVDGSYLREASRMSDMKVVEAARGTQAVVTLFLKTIN